MKKNECTQVGAAGHSRRIRVRHFTRRADVSLHDCGRNVSVNGTRWMKMNLCLVRRPLSGTANKKHHLGLNCLDIQAGFANAAKHSRSSRVPHPRGLCEGAVFEFSTQRRNPAYCAGLPSVDAPLNTVRPSAKVILLALAILEPSLARKPSTVI